MQSLSATNKSGPRRTLKHLKAMTTKGKFKAMLIERGMFDTQADEVIEAFKPRMETDGYNMTWDRPACEYPDAIYTVGSVFLFQEAIKWIDANKPMAWFRPMFLSPSEIEAATKALQEK